MNPAACSLRQEQERLMKAKQKLFPASMSLFKNPGFYEKPTAHNTFINEHCVCAKLTTMWKVHHVLRSLLWRFASLLILSCIPSSCFWGVKPTGTSTGMKRPWDGRSLWKQYCFNHCCCELNLFWIWVRNINTKVFTFFS